MRGRRLDIAGKRFGRWTVLAIHRERRRYGRARKCPSVLWLCRCDCGAERIVFGRNLHLGRSTSCGCYKREKTKERSTKHGQGRKSNRTPAYTRWLGMLQRCLNPNATGYQNYGGRGISVCERWRKFENFYADMGDPPAGNWIDRIDNDGNYEPDNCRWITPLEQAVSRRPRKRKRRRSSLEAIQAYAASLARAGGRP